MSWRVITEPDVTAPAYAHNALVYEWVNDFTISSGADSSGKLELTMSDTSWNGVIQVGDFIWCEFLQDFDGFDSALAEVTAIDIVGATITLDVDWQVDFSSITGDTVRITYENEFIVLTGYGSAVTTKQPTKTTTVRLESDPQGIYRLNVAQYVWSRFDFGNPPTTVARFNSIVEYYAYPSGGVTPDLNYALKQVEGTQGNQSLVYDNLEGFINYKRTDLTEGIDVYYEVPEAPKSATYDSLDGANQILGMAGCKEYTVLFSTSITDADTTITPSGFFSDPQRSLITSNAGQTIDGFTIQVPSLSGALDVNFLEDDGINPPVEYDFSILYRPCLTTELKACANGVHLIWWHPEGGWVQYQFTLRSERSFDGGDAILQKLENVITPVEFDDTQQTLTLSAKPESEEIFDYLNSINRSLQVFWKRSGEFVRVYPDSGEGVDKTVLPYLAVNNRWQQTFTIGEVETRIKQSR